MWRRSSVSRYEPQFTVIVTIDAVGRGRRCDARSIPVVGRWCYWAGTRASSASHQVRTKGASPNIRSRSAGTVSISWRRIASTGLKDRRASRFAARADRPRGLALSRSGPTRPARDDILATANSGLSAWRCIQRPMTRHQPAVRSATAVIARGDVHQTGVTPRRVVLCDGAPAMRTERPVQAVRFHSPIGIPG